jgi:hypothetical protein
MLKKVTIKAIDIQKGDFFEKYEVTVPPRRMPEPTSGCSAIEWNSGSVWHCRFSHEMVEVEREETKTIELRSDDLLYLYERLDGDRSVSSSRIKLAIRLLP